MESLEEAENGNKSSVDTPDTVIMSDTPGPRWRTIGEAELCLWEIFQTLQESKIVEKLTRETVAKELPPIATARMDCSSFKKDKVGLNGEPFIGPIKFSAFTVD